MRRGAAHLPRGGGEGIRPFILLLLLLAPLRTPPWPHPPGLPRAQGAPGGGVGCHVGRGGARVLERAVLARPPRVLLCAAGVWSVARSMVWGVNVEKVNNATPSPNPKPKP